MTAARVAYSQGLILACETKLRSALGTQLTLKRKPQMRSNQPQSQFFCSILQSPPLTDTYADENESAEDQGWTIAPLLTGNLRELFWFGLRLRFDHYAVGQFRLGSASVLVLHSNGAMYVPLVRAEWHYDSIEKNQHAQPHWHVYQNMPQPSQALHDSEVKDFLPDAVRVDDLELDHVHFAMATKWIQGDSSGHCENFEKEQALADWLDGLLRYLRSQVEYLADKRGLRGTVREFQ